MRIVVTDEKARPDGGQERCLLEVTEGIARRGHDLTFLYNIPGALLERYEAAGCETKQVGRFLLDPQRRFGSAVDVLAAVTTAVRARPDVVYVNDYQHTPFGALAASIRRVPLVAALYLLPPDAWARQLRVALPRVTRFVAVADHVRTKFAAAGVRRDRIDVVHIGVDLDRYRPAPSPAARQACRTALGFGDDDFVVMFSGRIDHVKGIEVLLAAFTKLRAVRPSARLLVAGSPVWHSSPADADAYVTTLKSMVDERWSKWLPSQLDVIPLYQAADVVVVPSLWEEPFSRVVIEAMACGTPVVGSRAGGTPEALTGNLASLLFETGDADDLFSVLDRLYGDSEGLAATVRRHVEENFSEAAMIDGIEATLAAALN